MAPTAAYGLAAAGGTEDGSAADTGCGAADKKFNALRGLVGAGAAEEVVFCLAISAKFLRILEASGAAEAPLAGWGGTPKEFEPGAVEPSGVVDSTSMKVRTGSRERRTE